MDDAARRALTDLVGPEHVLSGDAASQFAVDGLYPTLAVSPGTPEEVAAALALAERDGLGVIPWGGGTGQGLGNLPRRYDLALSLGRLNWADNVKMLDLHRSLLSDKVRTESYQRAIPRPYEGGCGAGPGERDGHPHLLRLPGWRPQGVCRGMLHMEFEWDPNTAARNLRWHSMSFSEAATVFGDPLSITVPDPDHSVNEDRYITIGVSDRGRLLMVAHTEHGGRTRTRTISARELTRTEREQYEEGQRA